MDVYIFNTIIASATPVKSPADEVVILRISERWLSFEGHWDMSAVLIKMHVASVKSAKLALRSTPTITAYIIERLVVIPIVQYFKSLLSIWILFFMLILFARYNVCYLFFGS